MAQWAALLLNIVFLAAHLPDIGGNPLLDLCRHNNRKIQQYPELVEAVGDSSQLDESADNRQLVSDSSQNPYIAIGPLVSALGDSQRMGCTGSLIYSNVVLTAAHCLLNIETGQEASASEFAPGYNSRQDPPGPLGVANMVDFRIPQSFRDCGVGAYSDCHRQNDFAVVKLDTAYATWLPFGFDDENTGGETINTAGYPGEDKY